MLAGRLGLRALGRVLVDAAAVAVATVGLLVVTLRLWEANLRVPFVYNATDKPPLAYGPDAPYYLMVVKGLIDHGSYLRNASLGWPFGLQLYDNPESGDNLQLMAIRGLGFLLRDAVLTVNVYYLLTFVAVSLAAWFVLRRLGVSRLVAAVVAILYSFVPYHFARGEAHLLLSGYFMVPVATLLILRVLSSEPPFTAAHDAGWRLSFSSQGAVLWLLACAALGSTGPYYAFFAALLLVAAVALDLLARREWRAAASGAVAVTAILVVLAVNLSPSLLYWHSHGHNRKAIPRGVSETEVDGLRVSQLLLPRFGHRIGLLADAQTRSNRFSPVPSERGQQLGIIGALGFVGLVAFTLSRLLRRRDEPAPRGPPQLGTRPEILQRLGVLTVVAIVCAAVSGVSLIISALGLRYIRSYNRISIFIAFFALITVAFALDWLLTRLPGGRGRPALAAIVCMAVLLLGVFDQTSPRDVPDYHTLQHAWTSDDTFMHHIARTLGPRKSVFELPYVFFPEAGIIVGTGPYDQARGWLHADSLKWSWGSVRGRGADWQAALVRLPAADALDGMVAVGFSGVMVDRAGYQDHARFLSDIYAQFLGERPSVSPDGRLMFWDLRPRLADLHHRLTRTQIDALRRKTLAAHAKPPGALT